MIFLFQKCTPDEEERFVNLLYQFLSNKPYANHVYKKIFSMSNREREEKDVHDLRTAIENLALDHSYDVPLLWFKLKESIKHSDQKWLSWEEVQRVAKETGIEKKRDLQAALTFFHEVGEIYFDIKSTSDFIVTDPQWLVDQLKEIITIPSFREQRKFTHSLQHWGNLERHGVLHQAILDNVWSKGTMAGLVAIMRRFSLLLPVPANYRLDYVYQSHKQAGVYFVPSLLPPASASTKPPRTTGPPVMLVPPNNFIPVGLTSRLIASLINEDAWLVVGSLYKDSATFAPMMAATATVSLTQKGGMIKVTGNELVSNKGYPLRGALQTIAVRLDKLSGQEPFTAGIFCSECHYLIHIKLRGSGLKPYYICPGHHSMYDPSEYAIWFKCAWNHSMVNDIHHLKFIFQDKDANRIVTEYFPCIFGMSPCLLFVHQRLSI